MFFLLSISIKRERGLQAEIERIVVDIEANEGMQRQKKQIQRTQAQIASGDEILFHGKVWIFFIICLLLLYFIYFILDF
jgi:hypothetical protein